VGTGRFFFVFGRCKAVQPRPGNGNGSVHFFIRFLGAAVSFFDIQKSSCWLVVYLPLRLLSLLFRSVSPARCKQSSEKLLSSSMTSGGMLSNSPIPLSSLGFSPRVITLVRMRIFRLEIFKSIFTDSAIPGILKTVSSTRATSFAFISLSHYYSFNSVNKNRDLDGMVPYRKSMGIGYSSGERYLCCVPGWIVCFGSDGVLGSDVGVGEFLLVQMVSLTQGVVVCSKLPPPSSLPGNRILPDERS
jgi:hypothetical protein